MQRLETRRLVKTILLGTPLAIVMLVSVAAAFAYAFHLPDDAGPFVLAVAVSVASVLGLMWVTGFWGRWGILALFLIAPVIVVIDFEVNPVFPAGSIAFTIACLALFPDKSSPR